MDAIDIGDDVSFRFVKSKGSTGGAKIFKLDEVISKDDKIIEKSFEVGRISNLAKDIISRSSGIFFAVDYGSTVTNKISLRAIRKHEILSNPLENVGSADLSADVDFSIFLKIFSNSRFETLGPISQGEFLSTLGIKQRLNEMIKGKGKMEADTLISGVHRLIDEMGSVYKVFSAVSK